MKSSNIRKTKITHALHFPHIEALNKRAKKLNIYVYYSKTSTAIMLKSDDGENSLSLPGKDLFRINLDVANKWLEALEGIKEKKVII